MRTVKLFRRDFVSARDAALLFYDINEVGPAGAHVRANLYGLKEAVAWAAWRVRNLRSRRESLRRIAERGGHVF